MTGVQTCALPIYTALVGDAVVYDSNGSIVPGATFVSQSGYNYAQPLQDTNTPEPSTFGMIAIALGLFLSPIRKHRSS